MGVKGSEGLRRAFVAFGQKTGSGSGPGQKWPGRDNFGQENLGGKFFLELIGLSGKKAGGANYFKAGPQFVA
jgi:hypothetical protein